MDPLRPYWADSWPTKPDMGPLGPPCLAQQPQSLAQHPQRLAQQPQFPFMALLPLRGPLLTRAAVGLPAQFILNVA